MLGALYINILLSCGISSFCNYILQVIVIKAGKLFADEFCMHKLPINSTAVDALFAAHSTNSKSSAGKFFDRCNMFD